MFPLQDTFLRIKRYWDNVKLERRSCYHLVAHEIVIKTHLSSLSNLRLTKILSGKHFDLHFFDSNQFRCMRTIETMYLFRCFGTTKGFKV